MRCDCCGKEITENFFYLEGDFGEEFAQSDLEIILCGVCYTGIKNHRKGIPKPNFISDISLVQ
jgi:hypothetical protein